ncbi:hypothetical protein HC931_26730 [Candidatus Gracilibacteria bacterium]|nr:hypothetical protein [Candidatus Gracilibacteria bacterium]NJM89198.1 hypothetical protein [Hydrococcus sp. RU_2_2]NJP21148.1 hypothetical protein [Hydrococcus sp. CRU_1_1]
MSTKIFILSNLAILTVGVMGWETLASPVPGWANPLTAQGWSDEPDSADQLTPQWLNGTETDTQQSPQWSQPASPGANESPQWFQPSERLRDRISKDFRWSNASALSWGRFPATPQADDVFEIYPLGQGLLASNSNREPSQLTDSSSTTENSTDTEQPNPTKPTLEEQPTPSEPSETTSESPLTRISPMQPTAEHLGQGEVVFNVRNRQFFLPNYVSDDLLDADTAAYPNFGASWGITDNLEITFEFQKVDSASPSVQGDFIVTRDADQEYTLELKQQFWRNDSDTLALSGVLSLSYGDRTFDFRDREDGRLVEKRETDGLVVALQFPFTATVDERLRFTLSPTVAFFPEDSALFYANLPIENRGSFGTTFGFSSAISYRLGSRIILWGDAFVPVTGNNSISRDSGKPAQAIAYNIGLRYLVNPRLGIDVFASNSQGSLGSLALTADRDLMGFGAVLVFMPDFFGANRRYADSFGESSERGDSNITTDGIGFLDGGTLPSGKFLFNLQGGSQGILTSLRYGLLRDLEAGVFLDYIFGDVDESEQGISMKVRLLDRADGAPLTVSLAATYSLTNQPFINFFSNNRDEFDDRNLSKEVPFIFQGDDGPQGKLNLVTLSLPLHYQFAGGAAIWFTPTWGYAQRLGTEIAGFNLGGSIPLSSQFSLIGEVGANFVRPGNAFLGDERARVIPWTVGLRWDLSDLLGLNIEQESDRPKLELYLTNRVGSSTWHQFRVRDRDRLSVGVGVSIPFSF